mmetsp:Transcript_67542/g.150773  ORF Transcript_67542/g.150773 Transcript_67542/m.150773 type:complete len:219 (+) Transcript_67542:443-1099(+)
MRRRVWIHPTSPREARSTTCTRNSTRRLLTPGRCILVCAMPQARRAPLPPPLPPPRPRPQPPPPPQTPPPPPPSQCTSSPRRWNRSLPTGRWMQYTGTRRRRDMWACGHAHSSMCCSLVRARRCQLARCGRIWSSMTALRTSTRQALPTSPGSRRCGRRRSSPQRKNWRRYTDAAAWARRPNDCYTPANRQPPLTLPYTVHCSLYTVQMEMQHAQHEP